MAPTRTFLRNSSDLGLPHNLCQPHPRGYRLDHHLLKQGTVVPKASYRPASIHPSSKPFPQLALHLLVSDLHQALVHLLVKALRQGYRLAFNSSQIMVELGNGRILRMIE